MCGLVGFAGQPVESGKVDRILNQLRHRGPDYSGIASNSTWILGHNRLSIIDLDSRSHQPFYSNDRRYILVFNGEIYNYRSIREELLKSGYKFRTESDTEVILYSFAQWKHDCFRKLHGMFALAIIDTTEQKVVLARDRFGEKPLFYSNTSNNLIFGSELSCLTTAIDNPRLDYSSIIDFLHYGFVPAPKTIYAHIWKLLPGHYLEYNIDTNRITASQPYHRVILSETNRHSISDLSAEFNSIGTQVSSEISLSDVSLGAFLSGGIDSACATYFLSRQNRNIHTFTASFRSKKFDEAVFAQQTAQGLQVRNTTKSIDNRDFIQLYECMVHHYAEPHNDHSFIPTYLICKEAARFHKVMISGDGADELFCGYPRYHKLKQFSLLKGVPAVTRALATLIRLLPSHSDLRRQLSFASARGEEFFFHTMSVNFQPNEITTILGPTLKSVHSEYDSRKIVRDYLKELPNESHIIQKQRYLDIKMTLADDMLVKVDRASMANSLEVRPFFLHPLIADFALKLPVHELVHYFRDKVFLKSFLKNKIPNSNLLRRKMGFTFPFKEEITGSLRAFFDQSIKSLPSELIDRSAIGRLLESHQRNSRDYSHQINSLLNLSVFLKQSGQS